MVVAMEEPEYIQEPKTDKVNKPEKLETKPPMK